MKKLFLLFIFTPSFIGFGQEIVKTQDLGGWFKLELEKELKKDYTLSFSQEFRLHESFTEMDKYISEVGLSYKINRNFKLQGNVRYALNQTKNKNIAQDFRYNIDLRYKWKINEVLNFKYRLSFQTRYRNLFTHNYKGTKSDFRHKIYLEYKVNKTHELSLSGELWREFELYEIPHFGQLRIVLSDEISTKIGKLRVFAGVDQDIDSSTPLTYYITGIAYKLSL